MIVKDEEANLPACLESVAGLVDEIVVVDTGSGDRTKEVAARFGARVFDFPWVDDFAAARNESLRHATGRWVFWLDADDRLDEENRGRLRVLLDRLGDEEAAYTMKCLCLAGAAGGPATVVDHVRLFRNDPRLRWQYRVHEQILLAVRRAGHAVRWSDVVIHHAGYRDPELRRRKLARDLRLLHLENEDRPDDPFTLFVRHDNREGIADAVSRTLGRRCLGRPTYLKPKGDRKHSLLVKRPVATKCPDHAPQGLRSTVKATLLELQFHRTT
jgi:glycosyltransferase involved in cell wall biosynthesis